MDAVTRTRSRTTRPPGLPALSPALGEAERAYCYAIAMKYMKDEDAADDVTQDALLLAHRHRKSFRGGSRYSTWLYRVAATTALMHLRSRKRRAREVSSTTDTGGACGLFADRPAPTPSPVDEVAARESVAQVAEGLDELGDKYRDIFWMRYAEGYTESEIAHELALPLSTVKTRAHRARVAMRGCPGIAER